MLHGFHDVWIAQSLQICLRFGSVGCLLRLLVSSLFFAAFRHHVSWGDPARDLYNRALASSLSLGFSGSREFFNLLLALGKHESHPCGFFKCQFLGVRSLAEVLVVELLQVNVKLR